MEGWRAGSWMFLFIGWAMMKRIRENLWRRFVALVLGAGVLLAFFACIPIHPSSTESVIRPPEMVTAPERLPSGMIPGGDAAQLTRAGFAVLLMRELPAQRFSAASDPPIVVDIDGHWGRDWILPVVRLGWMAVFPDHRFRPDLPVTRGEVAQVFDTILRERKVRERSHPLPAGMPADLPREHLRYSAIRRVVEAGVMNLDSAGNFRVSRSMTGVEVRKALRRISFLLRDHRKGGD